MLDRLKLGTRIVTAQFPFPDWQAEATELIPNVSAIGTTFTELNIYLYTVTDAVRASFGNDNGSGAAGKKKFKDDMLARSNLKSEGMVEERAAQDRMFREDRLSERHDH